MAIGNIHKHLVMFGLVVPDADRHTQTQTHVHRNAPRNKQNTDNS